MPVTSAPASRLINREAVVLLGWGRAILLQLSHPLVAAGVSDFSGFHTARGGYLQRARHTVGAMLTLTFGTPAEADRVIDHINEIHRRVHGALREPVGRFAVGTPYDATDPALLAWVHVTLLDSILQAYETFVRPLSVAERDAFCAESAPMITRLGVPLDRLPMTSADLSRQFDAMLAGGDLAIGSQARQVAAALLAPSIGPATPMFSVARDITIGLLPPDIRTAYGFSWDDVRAQKWRRRVRLVRGLRGILPSMLCEWPAARAAA